MTAPIYTITLRHADTARNLSWAAEQMHGRTLRLPHLPRVGDCIRDGDVGTVTVTRVIFDANGGYITLEIE